MFKMKRTLLWVVVTVMSLSMIVGFSLAGCKTTTETTEATTAEATTEAAAKVIAVIVPPVENPFFGTMQVIAAAKAEELGYKTIKLVHDDDANKPFFITFLYLHLI